MTIKDLIGRGPDDLEKMTYEELRKACEPFLKIGPHVAVNIEPQQQQLVDLEDDSEEPTTRQRKPKATKQDAKAKLMAELQKLAALHGVDINTPTGIK